MTFSVLLAFVFESVMPPALEVTSAALTSGTAVPDVLVGRGDPDHSDDVTDGDTVRGRAACLQVTPTCAPPGGIGFSPSLVKLPA